MRIPRPRRPAGPRRTQPLRERLRGPWRLAVQQSSMLPTIRDGDWLLLDPTTPRWPRRGAVVAFREPDGGLLAIKRVAAGPGDRVPFAGGYLELADDEAWLTADATPMEAAATGDGRPIDSNRFGPVPVANLVGRVWFRYGPLGRIGRIPASPHPLRPRMDVPPGHPVGSATTADEEPA